MMYSLRAGEWHIAYSASFQMQLKEYSGYKLIKSICDKELITTKIWVTVKPHTWHEDKK